MKTSKVGIMAVAVLMIVTGVGFGIAQAAGTHSEQPVLSFGDIEAVEQNSAMSSYAENRPVMSIEDQETTPAANSPAEEMRLATGGKEFVPEGNWAGTDRQVRGPVETGAVPATVLEESWMKDYGND